MDAPDGVWARIADQIDAAPPVPGPELAKVFAMGPVGADISSETVASSPGRRRTASWILGAAAAVVLVVAVVAVVGTRPEGDPIDVAYAAAVSANGSNTTELVADGTGRLRSTSGAP